MASVRAAFIAAIVSFASAGNAARAGEDPERYWHPETLSPDADALPPGALARLGSARLKHPSGIHSLAVSGDGRTVASASFDCLILWDTATGRERFRYLSGVSTEMCMAAAGNTVVVANHTPQMRLIDMTTGRSVSVTTERGASFGEVAISADGAVAAAVRTSFEPAAGERDGRAHYRIAILDVARARVARELYVGEDKVLAIALSLGGKCLAELRDDGVLRFWDVGTGGELRSFPVAVDGVDRPSLAFSPTGHMIALKGRDDELFVLEAQTGKALCRLDRQGDGGFQAAFSPDGKLLAVGENDGVRLHRIPDGRVARRLPEPRNRPVAVAISRDGQTLFTGGEDGRVRVWEIASGRDRLPVAGHVLPACALAVSPDGRVVVSADRTGKVSLWDVATGRDAQLSHRQANWIGISFSADGARLAVATDREVSVWSPSTSRQLAGRAFDVNNTTGVAFVRGGRSLVCFDRQDVLQCSVDTLAVERRFPGRLFGCRHVVQSLDRGGALVATEGSCGEVVLLNEHGRNIARLANLPWNKLSSVALSPDGRQLAACRDDECILCDLPSGAVCHRWDWRIPDRNSAFNTFSADGRLLATSDERGVCVFEAASGGVVACLGGETGCKSAAAFGPDGRTLASAERLGPILLWDLAGTSAGADRSAPSPSELAGLWEELRGADAARACRAVWRFADSPGRSVAFLEEQLQPVARISPESIRNLVSELGSTRFATRQAAFRKLAKVADVAESALRAAAVAEPSAEAAESLGRLLHMIDGHRSRPTGERLRTLRAVQALEYMRTQQSSALLERLAGGAPDAILTRAACSALNRRGSSSR